MACPMCSCPFDQEAGVCGACGHISKSPVQMAHDSAASRLRFGLLALLMAIVAHAILGMNAVSFAAACVSFLFAGSAALTARGGHIAR